MKSYDLFIVGAGAAGISAALAAKEAGCRRILVADRGSVPGGILLQCFHRGFGLATFGQELTGPEFAETLSSRLSGPEIELMLNSCVLSVLKDRTAVISNSEELLRIRFRKMILAAGAREKNIGSLFVSGTRPSGIFTAGQAQEMINLRKLDVGDNILILGSGDLGMIIARRLILEGKHVIGIVEKNAFYGGMARNYHQCIEKYHIPLLYCSELSRIYGEERITAAEIVHNDTNFHELIKCNTLITALGLIPERSLITSLGMPEWLGLCGNCSRVHDIVDSAAAEGTYLGKEFGGKHFD